MRKRLRLSFDTKYPQGGENSSLRPLQREVPSNGLPFQAGSWCECGPRLQWRRQSEDGKPLVERIVTVTGLVINEPRNFLVPIGTPLHNLIEAAGGFTEEPGKVLVGGPMMVWPSTVWTPVVKTVNGILALSKGKQLSPEPLPCIKCARMLTYVPSTCCRSARSIRDA